MNEYRDKFKYTKKLKLFDDLVEAGLGPEDSYYNVIRVNMFYVFQYHDEKGQIADWQLNQSTDLITDSIKRVIKHLEPSLQNIVINNLALHFKNLSMAKAIDPKRKGRIGLLSRDIYKLKLSYLSLDNEEFLKDFSLNDIRLSAKDLFDKEGDFIGKPQNIRELGQALILASKIRKKTESPTVVYKKLANLLSHNCGERSLQSTEFSTASKGRIKERLKQINSCNRTKEHNNR